MPLLDLGQALRASEPNYREEAAYLPLLLAGLMLGASFLFGDGIISPASNRIRQRAKRHDWDLEALYQAAIHAHPATRKKIQSEKPAQTLPSFRPPRQQPTSDAPLPFHP